MEANLLSWIDAVQDVFRRLGDAIEEALAPRPKAQPQLAPIPVYNGHRPGSPARRG